MRYYKLVIFVFLYVCYGLSPLWSQCYKETLQSGIKYYNAQNYTQAKKTFTAARNSCPDSPSNKSEVDSWIGKCDAAVRQQKEAAHRREEQQRQREEEARQQRQREDERIAAQRREEERVAAQRRRDESNRNSSPITTDVIAFSVNGVHVEMLRVEGGTFQMGSNNGESDEKPVHSVTLSDYYIGKYEVPQSLWQTVMGSNPSRIKGDNLPIEMVSWDDCQKFISKLNRLTGKRFRLPTEAEWEYAARGGNQSKGYTYSGSNTIGEVAEYEENNDKSIKPVGGKRPNELGLYDMSGNVSEWCSDWYDSYSGSSQINPTGPSSGSYPVIRGGGCFGPAKYCRVAYRSNASRRDRGAIGLRLAL